MIPNVLLAENLAYLRPKTEPSTADEQDLGVMSTGTWNKTEKDLNQDLKDASGSSVDPSG